MAFGEDASAQRERERESQTENNNSRPLILQAQLARPGIFAWHIVPLLAGAPIYTTNN